MRQVKSVTTCDSCNKIVHVKGIQEGTIVVVGNKQYCSQTCADLDVMNRNKENVQ